jgi:hypothetical protein
LYPEGRSALREANARVGPPDTTFFISNITEMPEVPDSKSGPRKGACGFKSHLRYLRLEVNRTLLDHPPELELYERHNSAGLDVNVRHSAAALLRPSLGDPDAAQDGARPPPVAIPAGRVGR